MPVAVTNELLYNVFAGTLSAEKETREAAEQALGELSAQHPDLVLHLTRFACEPIPTDNNSSSAQRNVLLAAAIRVRNVLGRSDWNRNPYFTEAVKLEVRQLLVPLQCQAHVSEHVRRQLLDTTKEIMAYDYPDNWPGLIAQLNNLLDGWVAALRSALEATGHDTSSDPVGGVVRQLRGGLGVLRACCKIYEDPLRCDAGDCDRFSQMFLPSLILLSELFYGLWRSELASLEHSMPALATGGSLFEFTPILTELSHCLRLILKCSWSFVSTRMPKCLCSEEAFQSYWNVCIGNPLMAFHETYLPACRVRLQQQASNPSVCSGGVEEIMGDHFPVFQESALWKQLKWVYTIAYKLAQEFMHPKRCEKRVRGIATGFRDAYLLPITRYSLELIRWHSCPLAATVSCAPVVLLTSKAYIMALEIVTSAVESKAAYTQVLHPAAEELMTGLLFPRLAFSLEDAEQWQCNPEEYVRKQSNPVGDLFSAKVVSASCLLSLAVPTTSGGFQDPELLGSLVNFLMNQLQAYSAQAAVAVSEERSGHFAMEAARRVDAAFFCMYQFKKVLTRMQLGDDKLEFVLVTYAEPATRYPLGFLRARAVLVLSVFAPSIQWSGPAAYQAALQSVLPLLSDVETPVRVQTCVSFSRLIRHPFARAVVTPCIAQLIQHYFDVMRLMDNEAVVRTLRKTITYYHDSLSQWGLELADMLVSHFQTVLHNVTFKYRAMESESVTSDGGGMSMGDCLEDDGFADVLMAADELLDTLTTLVKALPADDTATATTAGSGGDPESSIFSQLQHRISPMLYAILNCQSGSTYGFMDPVLMLLTTLLARSIHVAAPTWRLLPCLANLIISGGAVDYYGQMLAPLDNFASVATESFLYTPLHTLCGGGDVNSSSSSSGMNASSIGSISAEMLQCTPLQFVQEMSAAVLSARAQQQLRFREIGAVPKLYESIFQNLWVHNRGLLLFPNALLPLQQQQLQQSGTAAAAVVSSTAHQLVFYLGSGPLSQAAAAAAAVTTTTAGKKRRRKTESLGTATLRVLFANALFSCVMADAASALQVLASVNALGTFYEQYVSSVLGRKAIANQGSSTSSGGGGVLSSLRSHDKNVFVLSFCEAIRQLLLPPVAVSEPSSSAAAAAVVWTDTHAVLAATLTAVVDTAILESFAKGERETGGAEIAFLEKRVAKLQRRHAAAATGARSMAADHRQQQEEYGGDGGGSNDNGDGEEWEDEDDDDDDDDSGFSSDDDDDHGGFGLDDDDDDDQGCDRGCDDDGDGGNGEAGGNLGFGSEDAAYFSQDKKLQSLLKQAQELRGGGGGVKGRKGSKSATAADADDDEFEDVDGGGGDPKGFAHAPVDDSGDNDDDNLLDEEDDDFSSPADAINVWAVLVDDVLAPFASGAAHAGNTNAAVVGLANAIAQHNVGNVFFETRSTIDRLFAARTALEGFSGGA